MSPLYLEDLKQAQERGWAVPLNRPIRHAEWVLYWDSLSERSKGIIRGPEPAPPDSTLRGSREEARQKDYRKYWPGTSCAQGHIAPRYVSSGACSICRRHARGL